MRNLIQKCIKISVGWWCLRVGWKWCWWLVGSSFVCLDFWEVQEAKEGMLEVIPLIS